MEISEIQARNCFLLNYCKKVRELPFLEYNLSKGNLGTYDLRRGSKESNSCFDH